MLSFVYAYTFGAAVGAAALIAESSPGPTALRLDALTGCMAIGGLLAALARLVLGWYSHHAGRLSAIVDSARAGAAERLRAVGSTGL